MLNYYTIQNHVIHPLSEKEIKEGLIQSLWIDIIDPTEDEEKIIENYLKINIPTHHEMSAIELSNRLYQKKEGVYVTATFATTDQEVQAVTFILMSDKLITIRYAQLHTFDRYLTYSKLNHFDALNHKGIFAGLMETTIGQIADNLEKIGHSIDGMTQQIFRSKEYGNEEKKNKKLDYKEIIRQIGNNGDFISKNHESLIGIYRALNFIIDSTYLQKSVEDLESIKILVNDIPPLNDYVSFLSNKINFLLDACLGMINIEQNTIIKIVSVAALIFFPPTLVASIYGMNFHRMPELTWDLGYPLALLLMVLTGGLPYWYFKRKGWI